MPRKRPKSLETDVYRKLWQLEHYAYVRGHLWKKSYRYTLIDDFRQHFTVANKEKIRDSVNSYLGLLGHINAYKLRREICRIIELSPMAKIFTVAPDYSKVVIRPQYTMAAYYRHKFKELKQHLKPYYYEIRKDCVRCAPGAAKLPVLD